MIIYFIRESKFTIMVINKNISWVTPNYFLDTDIYVMRYLPEYFQVNWIITKKKGERLDYISLIDEIGKKENITIEIYELDGKRYGIKGFIYDLKLMIKLRNADVVYLPSSMPYTLPFMIMFLKRKRLIVPIHNVRTPKGGSHYYINKIGTAISTNYFRNYVTFSQSQHDLLLSINPKANVLYAPFMLKDYGEASVRRINNLITFLCFGNIRRYKRIDVLIEAAQKAFEITSVKFRVIIAGRCENWEDYQKHIKYPGLFDLRIQRVNDEDIPNLFEECDYFVTPYQDIAQSGSLIVGINYNKPIIASRLEAFEEYVEDGESGFLIRPANLEDLTKVMIKILKEHHNIYEKLKAGQKKMISEKFDDEIIVSKYVDFISGIAK